MLQLWHKGFQTAVSKPTKLIVALERQLRSGGIPFLVASCSSLQSLANVAGMPVAGFRRAFARTFNTTPYQYELDQRIEPAKTLLSTTRMTMTEISVAAGFSSPSHFATTFKQRVGITPSAYRSEL